MSNLTKNDLTMSGLAMSDLAENGLDVANVANVTNVAVVANVTNVAVVGGGIIGLCTAYQLQKNGCSVTIFDKDGVVSEKSASFGNAGHFATEQVFPLAQPQLLMKLPKMLLNPLGPVSIKWRHFTKVLPWLIRFISQMRADRRINNIAAIKVLNTHAIDSWITLVQDIGCEELITTNGSLLTFESISATNVAELLAMYKEHGVCVRYVHGESLKTLAPQLNNNITGALYFTQVGHTKSPQFLARAIEKKYAEIGGTVVCEHVENIEQHSDDQVLKRASPISQNIITTNNRYAFDKIVVCAGAHSKSLVKNLGFNVPLEAERGYHLMLPIKTSLAFPIASHDRQFIITPMNSGLRLAGTVEFSGLDSKPNYHRSKMLLTHAQALLSKQAIPQLANLTVEQLDEQACWMGCRPSLPDSLPVIDQSPKNPNMYFNFGHQHLGLTWGAISGELMCDLVLGRATSVDTTPYRINRF